MERFSFRKIILFMVAFAIGFFVIIGGFFAEFRKNRERVAGVQTSKEERVVRGLVLPHHQIAKELIIDSLEKIKGQNYSYVVIIGPNHFQPEVNSIVTAKNVSGYSFESNVMKLLLERYKDILISDDVVKAEHSIMLHLPYIKNYFPEAKIIPLIVSPYSSKNDLYEKILFLASILPPKTLFIASVDFAHNLTFQPALSNNEVSIKAIESFDFETIKRFNDSYMDSPASILMLLKAMEAVGARSWETWYSSHSALIEDDPTIQGTSYVIGVFR